MKTPVHVNEVTSLERNRMQTSSGAEAEPGSIDPWYLQNLVCPIDHTDLTFDGHSLISKCGRRYPVVDGVPVLLVPDEKQTIGVARESISRAQGDSDAIDRRAPQLYLETLGISENEKATLVRLYAESTTAIDPVVMMLIGATCGNAYKDLIGSSALREYPIPEFGLRPSKSGEALLDIGCNWGRWSVAAARKGFSVVGIDPSLGAVMAARRIARKLNLEIKYVVADGRLLPFRDSHYQAAYSYSVLQHFSNVDVQRTLGEINRVLGPGGVARIQMANRWGLRSLQHQASRNFADARDFEVRYWTLAELKSTFSEIIGETRISVDCYFGLGWQWCDFSLLKWNRKLILIASEGLRRVSDGFSPIRIFADSVFCTAVKPAVSVKPHHGEESTRG